MIRRSFVVIGIVSVLLLALFSLVYAQDAGPQAVDAPQAALGTAFTYQGQLKSGGNPVNDSCDFQLYLYDSLAGTGQIGSVANRPGIQVMNGYFTITNLDFGGAAFTGEARWLRIDVRCPAGSGSYATLTPRQPLTPAPYALALRPGALISGSVSGAALTGINNTAEHFTAGVAGESAATWGVGVHGQATASSGKAFGVYGLAASTSGYGVYGGATAASGTTYGVKGDSASPDGYGVYGSNDSETGNGIGVYGKTASGNYGAGVYGETSSQLGYGVYGHNTAPGAQAYGVFGRSESMYGIGVRGESDHIGVEGSTDDGIGVAGHAYDGNGVGVYGSTLGDNTSIGVEGTAWNGTGVEAHSVTGIALAATGTGVISSTADTELYLSPFTAMRRDGFTDLAFTPLSSGGMRIKKVGTGTGERLVVLPISTAGVVFGAPVYVKSLEVCYKTSAVAGYVTGSGVYKGNDETYAAYLNTTADYNSTTRACYTVNATTRAVIDNSSYVQLHLYFTNATEPEITLFTVKLNLSEMIQ